MQDEWKFLDRAELRILETKFRMGLFEHPYALDGEELRKRNNCLRISNRDRYMLSFLLSVNKMTAKAWSDNPKGM